MMDADPVPPPRCHAELGHATEVRVADTSLGRGNPLIAPPPHRKQTKRSFLRESRSGTPPHR